MRAVSARLVLAVSALIALAVVATGCISAAPTITNPPPTEIPRVTILAPPSASIAPTSTPEPTPPTITPSPTPTPTATPTPVAVSGGTPSPGCINGWTAPAFGSAEYAEGLDILSGYMGTTGSWRVSEMRYFTGPDQPGIIEPRYDSVERWYIKAALLNDAGFRGRWLIEKRTDQILGVSAVAPWDTTGYESPDWTGFIGEGPPTTYLGLPGQWSGIPFDFVTGEGDGGNPGEPPEILDCLAGT
jgi:hypothetical protein